VALLTFRMELSRGATNDCKKADSIRVFRNRYRIYMTLRATLVITTRDPALRVVRFSPHATGFLNRRALSGRSR